MSIRPVSATDDSVERPGSPPGSLPTVTVRLTDSKGEAEPPSPWDRALSMITVIALVTLAATVGISYGRALAYPGDASVAVRTVDWLRDHGGGPVVDRVENWWYSRYHAAAPGALPPSTSTPPGNAPPPLGSLGRNAGGADGEGTWEALPTGRGGAQVGYATFLRPDPEHPDVKVGVAMFDQKLVSTALVAGTREPVPNPAPDLGQVPAQIRPRLVATFNSGYKSIDAQGGYYADHRELRPLRKGAASAIIDDAGKLSVGQWGRDGGLGPHVAAVRQNLELIVDDGRPVPGLESNPLSRWGTTGSQHQFTWRSALGTDPAGNLYYVAGDQLTLSTLAHALAATGATRGMELDIHSNMVHLFTYRHDGAGGDPVPSKLIDTMRGPATRYLAPDRRDFFALTRR